MKEHHTSIKSNKPVAADTYKLCFKAEWDSYVPGQFVMVSIPGDEVFLRRPFGIAQLSGNIAEICYKVVGKGTSALSKAEVGAKINVGGPFGTGFKMPGENETPVLIAGGYGIAPLLGLCRTIGKHALVYYGAKSASDLLYLDEIEKMGVKTVLATEDGSRSYKGMITELVARDLDKINKPVIYACGPKGLLKEIAKLSLSKNIRAQVSMEEHMACGMGVCNGCVCKSAKGEFIKTCTDGPVFDVEELEWK